MRESTIVKRIRKALEERGCLVRKNHGGPMSGAAGWPDLLVIIPPLGRHVHLEVKAPGNSPTELQMSMIEKIRATGGEAYVVYSQEQALFAIYGPPTAGSGTATTSG